jgi:hypothetical protein
MTDLGERLRRSGRALPAPQDDPLERLIRRRDRKRRNERLLAAAVSLALVGGVLGGTLAVLSHVGSGRGQQSPAAGGNVLGGSLGPRTGSAPALADGSFVYRTQVHSSQESFTAGSSTVDHLSFMIQTWWANDGSGRVEYTCITPDCENSYGFGPTGVFDPGQFPTDDDMTGLSADPEKLVLELIARSSDDGSSPEPAFSPGPELKPGVTVGAVLDAIVNILDDPNGSPELKAACFDVARSMPTVEEADDASDPAGRPAIRLRFSMDTWGSVDYFFDPATHLLMAEVSGGAGTGDAGSTTIYNEGIVDSTDATPTADQWLFPEAPPSP